MANEDKKLVSHLNPPFSAETSTNEYLIMFLYALKFRISVDFEQLIFVSQMPKHSDMRLAILQTDVNWNGKQISVIQVQSLNSCRWVLSFLTKCWWKVSAEIFLSFRDTKFTYKRKNYANFSLHSRWMHW